MGSRQPESSTGFDLLGRLEDVIRRVEDIERELTAELDGQVHAEHGPFTGSVGRGTSGSDALRIGSVVGFARSTPVEAPAVVADATNGQGQALAADLYVPPMRCGPAAPRAWLAPAIRLMAEHGNPRLAAELVLDLLPYQARLIGGVLRYTLQLDELGSFEVSLVDGRANVRETEQASADADVDEEFTLQGPARAFAEFAGGGVRSLPRGLRYPRVNRTRRAGRRLFNALSEPVTLADLARAEVRIWPGLLLAALVEAIEPAWTLAHSFTIAFSIEDQEGALLAVSVSAGLPMTVKRMDGEHPVDGLAPDATVSLTERAFLHMLAGEPADEQILLEGEAEPLERLLAWSDRVQGIIRLQRRRPPSWPPPHTPLTPMQPPRGRLVPAPLRPTLRSSAETARLASGSPPSPLHSGGDRSAASSS